MIRILNCLAVFIACVFCASAQVPVSWIAETSRPVSREISVFHGETVALRPILTVNGTPANWTPDTSVTLFWQTNGMDRSWWSADGTTGSVAGQVCASWYPTNDVGADAYTFFFRVSCVDGAMYRAFGTFAMSASPGFNPASMPPPSCYPTLASDILAILIPSLPTYDAWSRETAARIAADAELQSQINALASSSTGSVSLASQSMSALRLTSSDSNWWVSVSSGTATLWRAVSPWVELPSILSSQWPSTGGTISFPFSSTNGWSAYIADYNYSGHFHIGDLVVFYAGSPSSLDDRYWSVSPTADQTQTMTCYYPDSGVCTYHRDPLAVNYGSYARLADLTSSISSALASYNPSAATNALAIASNAWLHAETSLAAAQAADIRITAATNAIVRTYLISSNAWIIADFYNQTISVSIVCTNTTNTVSIGSGNSIDPAATNILWLAFNSGIGNLTSQLSAKADKAWGKYTPDGASNPDPAFMTFLNAPATLFASGCSWSTYGTYAVLTSPGTVAFASGSNGTFRVGPDSTNYFGYATGGSVTVGAEPDTINVINGGATNGYAEIDYLYSGGDFPAVWFTPSLGVDFAELPTASWTDNLDGTATVTVPATTSGGFWKATTSATFSSVFETTMPTHLLGGVIGATNALPVIFDSTIEISSGGHTYRIPAQFKN